MEKNKIYNMDCLVGLKQMEDKEVDIVFTDPPYNLGKDYGIYKDNLPKKSYIDWMQTVVNECKRVSRNGIIFFVFGRLTKMYWDMMNEARLIVLRKMGGFYIYKKMRSQYHSILTTVLPVKVCDNLWNNISLPGNEFIYKRDRFDNPGLTSQQLTKQILSNFSIEGNIILDPFMGTGTTAVCCKILRRNYVGFELNPKYIETAYKRLSKIRPLKKL